MEATEAQLEHDEQKFQKKLQEDQTQLEDKLDSIQARVMRVVLIGVKTDFVNYM